MPLYHTFFISLYHIFSVKSDNHYRKCLKSGNENCIMIIAVYSLLFHIFIPMLKYYRGD